MSKTKIPNVVRGGVAIPLGRNLYYMKGRKHSQGGIDIGKNPRTGLEVEDGEIIQMKPKELRVLSAQKGIGTGNTSPAQAVLNGANPDKVFQAQENFKDRNKINDDGSKYEDGGSMLNNIGTAASFLVPFAGTAMDAYDFVKKPSLENAGWLAASVLGDIFSAGYGSKAIRAAKIARNMSRAAEARKMSRINAALRRENNNVAESFRQARKAKAEEDKYFKEMYKQGYKAAGIYGLDNSINSYQEFTQKRNGGKIVDKVNESNADFVDRLKTPMRRTITDWATQYTLNPKIATHKLSVWEIDNNKGLIVPNVQNVNGKLIDFTRPPYNERAGLENAIKNNDVVVLDNYNDAKWYTENYKNYYPNFKNGGMIATINGNVKNGLISTPRPKQKCGGRRKAFNGDVIRFRDINPATRGSMPVSAIPTDVELEGTTPHVDIAFKRDTTDKPNEINIPTDARILNNYLYNTINGGPVSSKAEFDRMTSSINSKDPIELKKSNVKHERDFYKRQYSEGEYERAVKNGLSSPADIVAMTRSGEQFGRDYNADREYYLRTGKFSVYTDNIEGGAGSLPISSPTGEQTQTSNVKQTSSTGTSNTPRKGTTSVKPNTYSVTNYVIQKDGSVKADGTRTGSGFKQYERRKNQQTISDAKVSKSWRETIGDDADVLNYIANGDAFEHKRWQDRHSKMSQETGYNLKSGRAIKHEDVRQYSRDFNNKFNQANKKLGLYTTPAGKTGDNFYGDTKKCGGRKRAKGGLESPYEDDWYGAQVALRTLGNNLSREDMKYLQEQIDARRQAPTRRAAFTREDGYVGVIDELQAPKINPIDITKPTIDLSPISKTVVPEAQKRAALKGTVRDKFNEGPTLGDWIGAGVNLAAGLGDFFGTNAYLNKFKSPDLRLQPHLKLKTYYNNNAEIDEINRNVENISRDIDANTASSSTALARKINARNNATMAKNKSWQNKFNIQDERINTERKFNSNIDGLNADRFNRWSVQNAAINNAKYQAKANNLGNLMGNISGTVNDVIARIEARRNFNNNLGYIQGANPNVDDRIYEDTGVQFDPRRRRYINTQKGITFMARCGKRIKFK